EPPLCFACKQGDAEIHRFPQFRRNVRQHREAPGYMESADADLRALGAQLPGDIHRARILIGLDADQAHEATTPADPACDAAGGGRRVWLWPRAASSIPPAGPTPRRSMQSSARP